MQWPPLTNYVSYSMYRANPNPQRVTLTSYDDRERERSGASASRLMTSPWWKTELCCRLRTDWLTLSGQTVSSVRQVAADQPHSALPLPVML